MCCVSIPRFWIAIIRAFFMTIGVLSFSVCISLACWLIPATISAIIVTMRGQDNLAVAFGIAFLACPVVSLIFFIIGIIFLIVYGNVDKEYSHRGASKDCDSESESESISE